MYILFNEKLNKVLNKHNITQFRIFQEDMFTAILLSEHEPDFDTLAEIRVAIGPPCHYIRWEQLQ